MLQFKPHENIIHFYMYLSLFSHIYLFPSFLCLHPYPPGSFYSNLDCDSYPGNENVKDIYI